MSAEQAAPMILAIDGQNNFLHVYHNAQELLADFGTGAGENSGPLEFFDTAGYRLVGQYSPTWQLQGLTRTADSPDPDQLRKRVQNYLDHFRSYLKSHPDTVGSHQMTGDQALANCPNLNEQRDLETILKALTPDQPQHKEKDEFDTTYQSDGFWYNLFHGSSLQS